MKRIVWILLALGLVLFFELYVARSKPKLGLISFLEPYVARSKPKLEVSDIECVQTYTEVRVSGTVKNVSDNPLSLSANAVLTRNPDWRADLTGQAIKGTVTPAPLSPGESGRFEIHARVPRDWPPVLPRQAEKSLSSVGWCKIKAFTDDSTGQSVNYRARKTD